MSTLRKLGVDIVGNKPVIIVTGPPGSGFEEWSDGLGYPVYGPHRGNKAHWRDHPVQANEPIVLATPAPDADAKEYWVREARRFGFSPRIVVVMPPEANAIAAVCRDFGSPNDIQRARLGKSVKRWYAKYSPHPQEVIYRVNK